MVVPVTDHATQQIGAAQERAVRGSRSADHHVVAAAGAGVLAVQHELLGAQAALARQAYRAVVFADSSSQDAAG